MPVALSYPGVYVEELPSGSRTITGVATSVAAFVGRARRGPEDVSVTIKSFADYERRFGGLWHNSTMSYAVSQFFLNGGADARIVRVSNSASEASAGLPETNRLTLRATSAAAAASVVIGSAAAPEFTIEITGGILPLTTVSTNPSAANYVASALAGGDVVVVGSVPSTPPDAGSYSFVEGEASATVTPPTLEFQASTPGASSLVVTILPAAAGSPADEFILEVGAIAEQVAIGDLDNAWLSAAGYPIQLVGSAPAVAPLPGDYPLLGGTNAVSAAVASAAIQDANGDEVQAQSAAPGSALNETVIRIENVTLTGFEISHLQSDGTVLHTATTNLTNLATDTSSWGITFPTFTAQPVAGDYVFGGGLDAAAAVAATTTITIELPVMEVTAASAGAWGNSVRVRIDYETSDPSDPSLFNLIVEELTPGGQVATTETFRNLSTSPAHRRFADNVVGEQSALVDIELAGTLRPSTSGAGTMLEGGLDGSDLTDADVAAGIGALETADIFTLLCTPPLSFAEGDDVSSLTLSAGVAMCQKRNAMYIVDAPSSWIDAAAAVAGATAGDPVTRDEHVAVYFPRVLMPDMLQEGRLRSFAPCGVVAGVMARTDARRGIWKAPAGTEATALGVRGLSVGLTDAQQGDLNKIAVNCVRQFPIIGHVIWGARTWRGADVLASEWKYVPVRRLAMYIKETLLRSSKWIVFEPNDEPLWSQIRLSFGAFMHGLFRQGAFEGDSPSKAYFVKCDSETTTATDRNLGVVNIIVGFAPLKPAEFVVIKLQQIAGQGE